MLANQAVYLLEQSEEVDSVNEADNCRRIMALLLDGAGLSKALEPSYRAVLDALKRAGQGGKGVKVAPDQRSAWETQLDQMLTGAHA